MGMRRQDPKPRTEHDIGFDVALGAADPRTFERSPRTGGRVCPHCGEAGRVDIIDTARVKAYLTCRACQHEWEATRAEVMPLPIPR